MARVDALEVGLVLLAGEEIDDLIVELDPRLVSKQHDRAAGRGYRMVVKLHDVVSLVLRLASAQSG
jgi:hypothetical protein